PSELILPYAGFLVSDPTQIERLSGAPWNFWIVVVVGTIGNTVGSLIGYAIGAWGGRPFLERYGRYLLIRPHELELAERFFERYGSATAFFSRLLPIVRTFIRSGGGPKEPVQDQVVDDLEAASEDERQGGELRHGDHRGGHDRRDRRSGRASDPGHAGRRRALVRVDDRDRVGLPRRHVHLADAEAGQKHEDRQWQRRHERHEDQQHVRRQVREHHRVDQADARRKAGGRQRGDRGQDVRAEEDRAQQRGVGAEPQVEPVRQQALGDETAGEGTQREPRREPKD